MLLIPAANLLNSTTNSSSSSSSSECPDWNVPLQTRTPVPSLIHTRAVMWRSTAQRRTPSLLPDPIFTSLFFLLPSSPLKLKVIVLRSSGTPVTLRWEGLFFFFSLRVAAGGCPGATSSARRAPWGALLLRRYFTHSLYKRINWNYDQAEALAGRSPQQLCVDTVER